MYVREDIDKQIKIFVNKIKSFYISDLVHIKANLKKYLADIANFIFMQSYIL